MDAKVQPLGGIQLTCAFSAAGALVRAAPVPAAPPQWSVRLPDPRLTMADDIPDLVPLGTGSESKARPAADGPAKPPVPVTLITGQCAQRGSRGAENACSFGPACDTSRWPACPRVAQSLAPPACSACTLQAACRLVLLHWRKRQPVNSLQTWLSTRRGPKLTTLSFLYNAGFLGAGKTTLIRFAFCTDWHDTASDSTHKARHTGSAQSP